MKIYLDYIFFENVIINIFIIILFITLLKERIKKINIIIGIMFISLYTTVIYILDNGFISSSYMKIIIVIIYVYIIFKPKTIIELIKKTIYYYIFNFVYVGIIICLTLFFNINLDRIYMKLLLYVLSGIVLYIFIKFLWKMWKSNIQKDDLEYIINIGGNNIIGFVDTGNTIKDNIHDLDVIFIDYNWHEMLLNILNNCKRVKLSIKTVNNFSYEYGYIVNNISIYKGSKKISEIEKIVICFVKNTFNNKKYSALIGYNTYVDELKGVTFC